MLGNQTNDDKDMESDTIVNKAVQWCNKEKMRHFTVSATQRTTLFEPFVFLASKLNPPPSKSTFPQLSMGRKVAAKEN